jgi:nicotinamidase-related amidase
VGKLRPENTVFLLCDIQEGCRPIMWRGETIIQTAQYMTSVAKTLDIPIVITQKYTKVLGETISETFADPEDLNNTRKFEKKKFSMCTEEGSAHLNTLKEQSVLIFGIEAHVCVQQTCLDLLENGKEVHIVADGVSSQQQPPYDREIALNRMSQVGCLYADAVCRARQF